jgi:1,2-phenylacetyl-CoA epoxidase catalytic subunit
VDSLQPSVLLVSGANVHGEFRYSSAEKQFDNWERFSFGTWLLNAAPRLHRNKLATALANKLARIAWSILRNEKTFDINRHEATVI